ncbi:MAG: UDP-N-acetylmuramoyl-tripeptide--D-alanyl-D-alanine ligase [Micromonosporaceae bacterium]|nr:UDP-N-acetylmuramoyl-tripeptide--D-alanyl-D-alanine ligase [Micromonosporaceae bacterium]
MIALSLAEVAAATGGALAGADPATRVTGPVEFDSRRVEPGGLFVAFRGERVDGHDFAAGAVAAGAVAVLGTRPLPGLPVVRVADPLAALADLARAVLDRAGELTVVGVTGSSGKTTTKDLLAQVTARLGPTVAPAGSFNNELGHPYTVLRVDRQTRFLVLELGARGPGHIAYLCRVAPPRIGVVLNVGVAHLGEFGSVDAIAAAKAELVAALPPDGLAVLNADDPRVAAMANRTRARVVSYGESAAAQLRAVDVTLDGRGRPGYTLLTPEGAVPVRLPLTGAHQVGNTLAVAAVARELGMALPAVAAALAELRPVSPRRMDVWDRPDGVTVIDDSYNANPASAEAALRALAALGRGRRTVAVLGYLAELGDHERAGHEQVGGLAARLGVDRLVVVGEVAAPIHHGARGQEQWGGESVLVADQDAAVALLRAELRTGDVVLVKGSRYRTWEVADWLRDPSAVELGRDGATG